MACHQPTRGHLCRACVSTMRPAPERLLAGGIRVVAPFEHEGAARRLMHLLKYQGVTAYASLVADQLAGRLPDLPLAPIPRALSRRLRYGVDPALAIARELSARTGQPVWRVLSSPVHTRRRAGGDHHRSGPVFRVRLQPGVPVVLVDDVVTTGATLRSAAAVLGLQTVAMAAAANSAVRVTSLSGAPDK